MSTVKLAIRVRPFTERELKSEKDKVPVVNVVNETTVTITNIKVSLSGAGDSRERVRRYYADYTFDSSCSPTHPAYASQEKIFDSIGREVISSFSNGLSACVLAYGQSATGKTHTMMGSEAQPGLVPRLCLALADDANFEVTVSFLEIYNERVHDLLAGEDAPATCHSLPRRRGNARKDLRVREHPSKGPYVQNLRRVAVRSVEALLSLVGEGARRRRTAATRRNSASSRSHALLELVTPRSTLHLADLAGSEKASWEGVGGGRQKEGANINKSLVALSNVISALVSARSGRGRFVPYRDSALTWLLKDCFTGGARTFIIATVSPSVSCYGESASTLRWAERARQLPTQRVNPSGLGNATRAALQAQFNQLLAELAKHHIRYVPETGKIAYDESHWELEMNNKSTQLSDVCNTLDNKINTINLKNMIKSPSTSSSVASGSSDVIYTTDANTNVRTEISKEVDDLFGPALERTRSGSDLKNKIPLKEKKRRYRSQEVLSIIPTVGQSQLNDPNQSGIRRNETENTEKVKPIPVEILYDNQRAEIVASVTERLYSKIKKKEETAVSKMESIVDKKIVEPLSELKICTNARQRLLDLSQKALRQKRRLGIPAHTQTRKSVIRMKDTGTDVQRDLEPYAIKERNSFTLYRDIGVETMSITPRCKEIAVGPCGSLDFRNKSTSIKPIICRNAFVMTDVSPKCNRYTQTPIVPPPRRKKKISSFTNQNTKSNLTKGSLDEYDTPPVISINISQTYIADSDSQSSDELTTGVNDNSTPTMTMTPDLLTNHGIIDVNMDDAKEMINTTNTSVYSEENKQLNTSLELQSDCIDDFSDSDDSTLPRVNANTISKVNKQEMKKMILGRNENIYPYNIVISPFKENTKRSVKFQGYDTAPASIITRDWKNENDKDVTNGIKFSSDVSNSERDCDINKDAPASTCSDSALSSKAGTDSFIWKRGDHEFQQSKTLGCPNIRKTPVYISKYKSAKRKMYREFLGLDRDELNKNCYPQHSVLSENAKDVSSSESSEIESLNRFRQRKTFFENQNPFNNSKRDNFEALEKNILESCDRLDAAVDVYDNYLINFRDRHTPVITPKKYLQHLVQLRREVVKADSDSTDCSVVNYDK